MAQIRFGPAGTYQNTFNVNPSSIANLGRGGIRITPIRVLDIILDNSHPKFKEYGEWNSIGTIFYEEAYYGSSAISNNSISNTIAIPLLPNIKQYPLINELTYVIFLPGANLTENPNSSVAYYFPPSNVWNSQHHNAVPVSPNLTPAEDRDYVSTTLGSYRRVTDNSTDIFLGKTFDEKTNLHPLLPYEGDTIYEGRWGNSIRLGSTEYINAVREDLSKSKNFMIFSSTYNATHFIDKHVQTHEKLRFITGGGKADNFPKWFYDNNTVQDFENGLAEFKGKKNLKFLQIGVFTGNASAWLLKNILTDPTSLALATHTLIHHHLG